MKITDEKSIAQNQKVANGKSRKMLTFDFYPSRMDAKTIPIAIEIEQKIQNNTRTELSRSNFSKMEKGQCVNIDLKLNIPSIYVLNKKEVCMN